jgi:nicotinamidase-related amidase
MVGTLVKNRETTNDMRILREESSALVIDFQERLLPHIDGYEQLMERAAVLLEGFNVLEIPILITEQYRKGLGPTVEAVAGKIKTFDPVEKVTFSCCDEESVMSRLQQHYRKFIIICGIETHVCVMQTVTDLIENGFQPVVAEDCVGSRKPNDKQVAIERMRQEGAIIGTCESILFELARVSGTEQFKAISKLVK